MTLQQLLQHCKYSFEIKHSCLLARLEGRCDKSPSATYQQQSVWKAETGIEVFEMNMKTLAIPSGTTCNS